MQTLPGELARSVLDAAPDALIIVDTTGVVRFANRQAAALFGYGHEQLVGRSMEQLLPERFRSLHVAHRDEYFGAPRLRPMGAGLALFARRRDGSEFPVEISLSPIDSEDHPLVAAAIRDVTQRKRVEAELTAALEAADRARAVADHLREVADEARQSADRANQAKSRFLATASHDLRQPLQSLALLSGALRRIVTSPEAAEVLVQQEHAVGAMSRLLNALLDISKLESGAVKPEPRDFRIGGVLETIRREFAAIAGSKGLALTVEPSEASIRSDPAMVEQILKNLVSNAVKYTDTGQVTVRCRREGPALRIEVIDTGVGIPAAQLAYIYDEFFQVGVSANSSRDGYGLGLSIVERLVRLLNVRLEAVSEVGKGSVFALLLPLAQATMQDAQADESQIQSAPPAAGGARVLLVEDDASVRDATGMLLRVEGYRVSAVASLPDAVRSAAERAPDLLVTDYHLGNGELGTEVIAVLRERVGRDLRAVLLTGDTTGIVNELRADPNLRVMNKPVDAEELLRVLRTLLGS
ncbi:MAG TPA: ATP-binding protein [Steroidobacteraceae bacterium]|jgi:PAS domain S-box-containing protein|nr:ATP-binding protein [Steroidobacteraceae bacterium]